MLAPTACVLWFMNAATRSQGAAARQSVTDAYRGQLRLLRDRADSFWRDRAAALDGAAAGSGPEAFQRIVGQGLADSVVLPDYPSAARETLSDLGGGGSEWQAAQQLERTSGNWRRQWKPTATSHRRREMRRSRPARHRRRFAAWCVRAIKRKPYGLSRDTSSPADLAATTGATARSPPTNCCWGCAC